MRDDVCFLRPSECNFQHSLPLRTKHLPGRSQRIWLLSCVAPTNNAGCVLPLEGVHKPVCSTDEATRIASLKGQIQAARNIEAEKFPEILRLTNEINLPEQVDSAKKKQKKRNPPWQQQEDSLLIEIAKKAERHVILISPYENSFHVLFCFLL